MEVITVVLVAGEAAEEETGPWPLVIGTLSELKVPIADAVSLGAADSD